MNSKLILTIAFLIQISLSAFSQEKFTLSGKITDTNTNESLISVNVIIPELKVDKIRLTDDQSKEFNNLALQLTSSSITMKEAILQLRGGGGLTKNKYLL